MKRIFTLIVMALALAGVRAQNCTELFPGSNLFPNFEMNDISISVPNWGTQGDKKVVYATDDPAHVYCGDASISVGSVGGGGCSTSLDVIVPNMKNNTSYRVRAMVWVNKNKFKIGAEKIATIVSSTKTQEWEQIDGYFTTVTDLNQIFFNSCEGAGADIAYIDNVELYEWVNMNTVSMMQTLCNKADSLYDASKPEAKAMKDAADASRALIAAISPDNIPAQDKALSDALETLKQAIADFIEPYASSAMDYSFVLFNPDFETSLYGWTSTTGAQNQGFASNKTLLDGSTHFWENWNGSPYTGQLFQVATGLPNGNYTLKAAAYDNNQTGNVFLYGGDADIATTPVTTSNMAYYTVNFAVTNNSAEIGLFITNDGTNWVGIDNVSLTYWGTSINALKSMLTVAKALTSSPMESSVATELAAAIAQAQGVVDSGSNSGVDEAIGRLSVATEDAKNSIAMYVPLKTAIDAANANKSNYTAYPGYADFIAVLDGIEKNFTSGAYTTNEEIQQAIIDLINAENACKVTNPYTPADFTAAIQNPSFEYGQGASLITSGGTYNVPNSWEVDSINDIGGGWTDAKIIDASGGNKDAPHDGKYLYNVWASAVNYFNLYQDVSLPVGTYTLTAVMRTNVAECVGDQHIYAEVDGVKYPSNLMTFNPDAVSTNGGANWASFDAWSPLTTDFELTAPATVRIGAESTGGAGSVGWFQLDDFRLMRNTGGLSGIKVVNPGSFSAFGIKDAIVVKSNAAIAVKVYSVLGILIRNVQVTSGETHIAVPAGMYIVNGSKVIVR